MSRNKQNHRPSFFKSHADTIAIMAVNLAIAGLLISMIISNSHRIDSQNARSDALHAMFIAECKNFHDEVKDFHGRLCSIEERNKK